VFGSGKNTFLPIKHLLRCALLSSLFACGGGLAQDPCPVGMALRASACWTPDRPVAGDIPSEYTPTVDEGTEVVAGPPTLLC